MKLYRIGSLKFPIFSGRGAALNGGRWNSKRMLVIYTSTSFALARLEKLVQLGGFLAEPQGLGQVEIDVPENIVP